MEIEDALRQFGLTELESKLYLLLLKTGETTAPSLVAGLKVHKATVYDLLAVLERKGIVSHIVRDDRRYYSPLEPKRLLDILEDRMGALKEVYPILEKYYSSNTPEREIRIFEGKNGIKTMFNDIIRVGKPLFALGSSLQMLSLMEHRAVHPLKNMRSSVPYSKAILSDKKEVAELTKRLRELYPKIELRYYPEKISNPVAFNTYGDRTTLMLWQAEPVIIRIRDPCIAKGFKSYFDIIWSVSKK